MGKDGSPTLRAVVSVVDEIRNMAVWVLIKVIKRLCRGTKN